MTANDNSPGTGYESTDFERGTFPLSDAPDEEVAEALAEMATEANAAVVEVTAALEGEEPLTDAKLEAVSEAADALDALAESLALRVPSEGRADPAERSGVE
jgi:phosphate uptake regulator